MVNFEYDRESETFEVFDRNYRYLACVRQLESKHMFEILTEDNTELNVFVSDVRSTIDIIETLNRHKFFGGSTVIRNGITTYLIHFDEGAVIKSTFYKGVYQWVHKVK